MRILGIESSCDETALAIVSYENGQACIELNEIYSQVKEHERFGGVVPELAARAHMDKLPLLIENLPLETIDAIAATTGPGLIGGLHIGYGFGRALALAMKKPFYPVHHLEAHALTVRLTDNVDFPYLLLLISGGHTQIIDVQGFRQYKLLGQTKDDSCGEVFDKSAKLLDLGFPGGPAIERAAIGGDPLRYALPCPFYRQAHCDFSFSGLKTAIREIISPSCHPGSDQRELSGTQKNNMDPGSSGKVLVRDDKLDVAALCASIQHTVSKVLIDRLTSALKQVHHKHLVIAGGVAANQYIRKQLNTFCEQQDLKLIVPPVKLCTDNAAMVAWVGIELMQRNIPPDNLTPRPRWGLEELATTN